MADRPSIPWMMRACLWRLVKDALFGAPPGRRARAALVLEQSPEAGKLAAMDLWVGVGENICEN